jgi:dolichyl-phosphate-mannose-protein mannosyltransferase
MLLFFTALAVYSLVVFRSYQLKAPLSPDWFLWLLNTGISLGLVVSVKWVGLFTIAIVGLHTIDELWDLWGDLKMPIVAASNSEIVPVALGCPHRVVNLCSCRCIHYYICVPLWNTQHVWSR